MSTSYDLRCIDCGDEMGWMHKTDHMLKEMIDLKNMAPSLAVLADLAEQIDLAGHGLILKMPHSYEHLEIELSFFKRHAGHRIQVYNEYGQMIEDCAKQVVCACCGAGYWCKLKQGHSGACDHKARDGRK